MCGDGLGSPDIPQAKRSLLSLLFSFWLFQSLYHLCRMSKEDTRREEKGLEATRCESSGTPAVPWCGYLSHLHLTLLQAVRFHQPFRPRFPPRGVTGFLGPHAKFTWLAPNLPCPSHSQMALPLMSLKRVFCQGFPVSSNVPSSLLLSLIRFIFRGCIYFKSCFNLRNS